MSGKDDQKKAEEWAATHSVTVSAPRRLGVDEFLALLAEEERREEEEYGDYPVRVVAIIPGETGAVGRYERYELPLEDALAGIGVVMGGTIGSAKSSDGTMKVVDCSISMRVKVFAEALPIILRCLAAAGAPTETVVRLVDED